MVAVRGRRHGSHFNQNRITEDGDQNPRRLPHKSVSHLSHECTTDADLAEDMSVTVESNSDMLVKNLANIQEPIFISHKSENASNIRYVAANNMNVVDPDVDSQYPMVTNGIDNIPVGSKSMQVAPKDPIAQDVLSATEKARDSYIKDVVVNDSSEDRATGAAVANRVGDKMLAGSAGIYPLHTHIHTYIYIYIYIYCADLVTDKYSLSQIHPSACSSDTRVVQQ